MKAVLTNFGTTGDVLPLLALARELRRAGHTVVMACPPSHEETVASHGFRFVSAGPDMQDIQTTINQRWIAEDSASTSPADMQALLAPLGRALPQTYETLRELARGADVIVSGPAQPAARMVHETTAIPFASVQFSNFGGIGTPALQAATAALVNPFRERLGLRPLANPVTRDANSPQLALYAMSRHLLPKTAGWPPHYRVVGFFLSEPGDWTPEAPLREFLEGGEPPVVLSFGSMPHADPRRMTELIGEAVSRAGVRAVLQQGHSGLGAPDAGASTRRPDRGTGPVFVAGFVPHGWLFPRGACVVHHGGAGTAAAAFSAGKPTVYVPHGVIFDQTYWAQLSRDHGCSGAPIPFHELSATRLASAICECLGRTAWQGAASRLGEQVRAEHGVRTARRAIEELVRHVGLQDQDRERPVERQPLRSF